MSLFDKRVAPNFALFSIRSGLESDIKAGDQLAGFNAGGQWWRRLCNGCPTGDDRANYQGTERESDGLLRLQRIQDVSPGRPDTR